MRANYFVNAHNMAREALGPLKVKTLILKLLEMLGLTEIMNHKFQTYIYNIYINIYLAP